MATGILKFNLPEESGNFKIAVNSLERALTVWNFDQYLRTKLKYSSEGLDVKTLEVIREKLRDEMNDHGVSMEDIE